MVNLIKSKGFEDDDIKILVDDDESYESPNHVNVKNALSWLCKGREEGDIIFMHFSGHGTQVPCDGDDEEEDDLDEAICLEELFLMADDDLKQYFSELPEGAHATVVMDCCHSGSMLDGTEVAIEGAKDAESAGDHQESASLLNILGGSRAVDVSINRSLPISTICEVMSQKLGGAPVEPTGSGVNGALAKVFGGSAGKLMMKFAMAQLGKSESGGSDNPLMGVIGGFMGNQSSSSGNPLSSLFGGSAPEPKPESSNPFSSFLGGGGGGSSGSGGLSSLMGSLTGSKPEHSSSGGDDPLSKISGLMSSLGLEGEQSSSSAPAYNPSHQNISKDVCTLITGCQADETSADVRPPGGEAFGALTKTLTTIHEAKPDASYHDLVSSIRSELSKGGFKQNPCLECGSETAQLPFIC